MSEQSTTIIELGASFLLWLGGGSVVTIGASAFLSKFFADRTLQKHKGKLSEELERLKGVLVKDVETHKLSLRRAEMLFEREVNAAKEFVRLREHHLPDFQPGKTWDEAASREAVNFAYAEHWILNFYLLHGVVLSENLKDQLETVRWKVVTAKEKFQMEYNDHQEPSKDALAEACSIYMELKLIEVAMLQALRS